VSAALAVWSQACCAIAKDIMAKRNGWQHFAVSRFHFNPRTFHFKRRTFHFNRQTAINYR
jgi:hypothetical protein